MKQLSKTQIATFKRDSSKSDFFSARQLFQRIEFSYLRRNLYHRRSTSFNQRMHQICIDTASSDGGNVMKIRESIELTKFNCDKYSNGPLSRRFSLANECSILILVHCEPFECFKSFEIANYSPTYFHECVLFPIFTTSHFCVSNWLWFLYIKSIFITSV